MYNALTRNVLFSTTVASNADHKKHQQKTSFSSSTSQQRHDSNDSQQRHDNNDSQQRRDNNDSYNDWSRAGLHQVHGALRSVLGMCPANDLTDATTRGDACHVDSDLITRHLRCAELVRRGAGLNGDRRPPGARDSRAGRGSASRVRAVASPTGRRAAEGRKLAGVGRELGNAMVYSVG